MQDTQKRQRLKVSGIICCIYVNSNMGLVAILTCAFADRLLEEEERLAAEELHAVPWKDGLSNLNNLALNLTND